MAYGYLENSSVVVNAIPAKVTPTPVSDACSPTSMSANISRDPLRPFGGLLLRFRLDILSFLFDRPVGLFDLRTDFLFDLRTDFLFDLRTDGLLDLRTDGLLDLRTDVLLDLRTNLDPRKGFLLDLWLDFLLDLRKGTLPDLRTDLFCLVLFLP